MSRIATVTQTDLGLRVVYTDNTEWVSTRPVHAMVADIVHKLGQHGARCGADLTDAELVSAEGFDVTCPACRTRR